MRSQRSVQQMEIGTDCDREVVGTLGLLVRLAGWKRVLDALEGVAQRSGQPRIGGTILAAREWLYGQKIEEKDA